MRPMSDSIAVLEARHLRKEYTAPGGGLRRARIAAVDDVSLALYDRAGIISLVGESGSGKTTLSRLLQGLLPPTDGQVLFRGKDVAGLSSGERWEFTRRVQPVFQDPYGIYNPFYRVERVLQLVIRNFKLGSRSQEQGMMEEALRAVDLRPQDIIGRYPHQLSGGERQRVMLARVYLLRPQVIIADEPVSMIDVAVRTLFLNLLLDFRDKHGISCLFITHNLSTAYYLGGQMMVLCNGRIVESGDMDAIVAQPAHPYTQLLLQCVPSADPTNRWTTRVSREASERPLTHEANQCVYVARCPQATAECSRQRPPEYALAGDHHVACLLYDRYPLREET